VSALTAERRRHRQRADARRAILEATEALLVEGGYESFSIRRLAERCGYAAPTIYHYFGDKPGLIDALLEERFRTLLRVLGRVVEGDDPLETIRARSRAFVRFGLRNPTHYRLLTGPRAPDAPPPPSGEEARAFFEKPWLDLVAAGRITAERVEGAQQAFWALLHGIVSLRTNRPDLPWVSTLTEDSVDALLRGLVAGPEICTETLARPRRGAR
jgi:AcrR family transcriptional regulator